MGEAATILGRRRAMSGAVDVGEVSEMGDVQHESEADEVGDVAGWITRVQTGESKTGEGGMGERGGGEGESRTGEGETGDDETGKGRPEDDEDDEDNDEESAGSAKRWSPRDHPVLLVLPVFSSWRNILDEQANALLTCRFLDELLRAPMFCTSLSSPLSSSSSRFPIAPLLCRPRQPPALHAYKTHWLPTPLLSLKDVFEGAGHEVVVHYASRSPLAPPAEPSPSSVARSASSSPSRCSATSAPSSGGSVLPAAMLALRDKAVRCRLERYYRAAYYDREHPRALQGLRAHRREHRDHDSPRLCEPEREREHEHAAQRDRADAPRNPSMRSHSTARATASSASTCPAHSARLLRDSPRDPLAVATERLAT
ncbi:uncharacterized protein BXZ73DRAFT_82529 [Epithele typhae]|uniref:uncharacterized protein n=1 Tax=Epithele typhae TaxID=378194 RepID=UPI0020076756|nr:uncharacterized protein BXZ73DRAFT_82529 [Epithele typhae]KAH9912058.1 hypothetical protein BXZ73DRAFT_82529 [Epithele typhae]